jgi:SET and MYND domain-containing protein
MHSSLELRTTSYGGRSLFALSPIPSSTLLLSSKPFAHVIYRDFRKEVCAYCFKYAFDSKTSKGGVWKVRYSANVWFCSDDCRAKWVEEENVDGALDLVEGCLERALTSLRKAAQKSGSGSSSVDKILGQHGGGNLSSEMRNKVWAEVENVESAVSSKVELEDMEFEIARLVASALVRRHLQEVHPETQDNVTSWQGSYISMLRVCSSS